MQQSDEEPFCYERASPTIPPMVPTEMTCITRAPKGGGENFWIVGGGGVLGCVGGSHRGWFQIRSSWHPAGVFFGLFQLSVECFK